MYSVRSTFIAALRIQLCTSAPSTTCAHRFLRSHCWEQAKAALPLSLPGVLVTQIDCGTRCLIGSIKLAKNYTESWTRPPSSCTIQRGGKMHLLPSPAPFPERFARCCCHCYFIIPNCLLLSISPSQAIIQGIYIFNLVKAVIGHTASGPGFLPCSIAAMHQV